MSQSLLDFLSNLNLGAVLKGLEVNIEKLEADAHARIKVLEDAINASQTLTPAQKADAIAKIETTGAYFDKLVSAALPSNLAGLAPAIGAELKELVATQHGVVIHDPSEIA